MKNDIFRQADTAYNNGNFKEAFELFLKAAKNGDDSAMGRVACMYYDSEGVDYSFEKSIYWDMKAVEAGSISSIYNLGISYRSKGEIVQAKYWFEKSLGAGDSESALQLAKLYMVSDKEQEKVKYYLRKALDGDLDADDANEAETLLSQIEAAAPD